MLLPIIVEGSGLIPRINSIAPRRTPFNADLTLIGIILQQPGLQPVFVDPETKKKTPLKRDNYQKIYNDYQKKQVPPIPAKKEEKKADPPKVNPPKPDPKPNTPPPVVPPVAPPPPAPPTKPEEKKPEEKKNEADLTTEELEALTKPDTPPNKKDDKKEDPKVMKPITGGNTPANK